MLRSACVSAQSNLFYTAVCTGYLQSPDYSKNWCWFYSVRTREKIHLCWSHVFETGSDSSMKKVLLLYKERRDLNSQVGGSEKHLLSSLCGPTLAHIFSLVYFLVYYKIKMIWFSNHIKKKIKSPELDLKSWLLGRHCLHWQNVFFFSIYLSCLRWVHAATVALSCVNFKIHFFPPKGCLALDKKIIYNSMYSNSVFHRCVYRP